MPASAPPTSLPQVVLRGRSVEPAVLHYVPLATAEKYQVAAFEATETTLKLAIVHPEQLKQGFFVALKDLGDKIHKKVELYKTDAASLQDLLKQYNGKAADPARPSPAKPGTATRVPVKEHVSPKPPLFELGKTVAYNYLKRIPLDFAKEQRLVSVDFLKPNFYWCVTDGSNDPALKKIIPFIEKNNDIVIYTFTVSKTDLDDLLKYYETLEKSEEAARDRKEEEDRKKQEAAAVKRAMEDDPEPTPEAVPPTMAKGVIVPDVQAAIISSEEEKGGIAGLFQKVAQSLGPKGEVIKDQPPELQAEKKEVQKEEEKEEKTNEEEEEKTVAATTPAQPAPAAAPPTSAPKAKNATTDEEAGDIGKLLEKQVATLEELKEHIRKGFIPRIVAAVVSYAIHEKASDIHIESFADEVRIRYRIDGQLIDIVKLPPDVHAAMVSRIKILSRLRLDETRVPQDGRFDVNFEDVQVDVRVSVMPTVHGEKVVLRILDKSKGITSLEKLGIEGLAYVNLTHAIQKPFGICLATGPTGSGKSTSLYAILNRIATPNVNVVTLEDPVEYEMKGINQSQIRPKIGYTFAEGLRSILRQDPNIIMVGEIRDGETANMATQAALTGHLVLSTLHTNDAAGAIPRLSNMGIEPFLITSSLNVAMGQRLVRKICPNCKNEVNMPDGVRAKFEKEIEAIGILSPEDAKRIKHPLKFYQGTGCPQCGGKGYQGRIGIYEVLVMTEGIEDLTISRASNIDLQAQAQKEGMLTMYQDGLLKVINGVTTLDEVLRETSAK